MEDVYIVGMEDLIAAAGDALMRGLDPNAAEQEHHDMDDLIGTWVHDPDTEEALASMDTTMANFKKGKTSKPIDLSTFSDT